jgi:hypothetical protein
VDVHITNKLLFELGMSYLHFNYWISYRDEVRRATCKVAFASCPAAPTTATSPTSRSPTTSGRWRRCATSTTTSQDQHRVVALARERAHNFKVGLQWGWGKLESWRETNGDIIQRYRNGVPNQSRSRTRPPSP